MRFKCFFLLLCAATILLDGRHGQAAEIELSTAGYYRAYEGENEVPEYGFGVRGRYSRFQSSGTGWFVRFHIDEHIMAPVIIPSVAKRWGNKFFYEVSAGVYLGSLVGRGITLAIIPAIGYKFGNRFHVTLPIYWDLNIGTIWGVEYMPFLGYSF